MSKRTVSGIMLTLLFIGMLMLAFNIQPVRASGTIYIRADGSVDPDTAPISTVDNVTYTFTDNIYDEIVVERDNIVVDGAGYTLQGPGFFWGGKGIFLNGISNVTIKNTEIKSFELGIRLYGSSNDTISGNSITDNWEGIRLDSSSNNGISGNTITANYYFGIQLEESSNNTISENKITANCWYGIRVYRSSNNTLRNNDASNNKYNFGVYGSLLSDYIQDIDDSNTVNGKPIYYWVNTRDTAVPLDAGYVALVNCTRMKVQNLNLTNNEQGVLLAFTTNSTITKNNVTDNGDGIRLEYSHNGTISGNNVTNNGAGIHLEVSSKNSILRNNMANNEYGVYLMYAFYNTVYHNNFISNTKQVYDYFWEEYPAISSINTWDDGHPSGGNYWSDHVCTGNPSDGSQPYIIDENNVDHYPFQDPNDWLLRQLTVTSSPITGVTFTIDGTPQTTPYTKWLLEGSYTLEMPQTHNGYVWSHWLEDGDPNRTKTFTLPSTTWTGVFVFAVEPHSPEAEFTAVPETANIGKSVKFDASSSLPRWNGTHEMPITEYRWDFGDGNQTTTSTPIVYHSFSSSGVYYVTLTVYAPGATPDADSTTKKVTITAIPVGGYSIPIKGYTPTKPLTLYLALVAILAASFTIAKRRKKQQN